jgi:hypothetical protein
MACPPFFKGLGARSWIDSLYVGRRLRAQALIEQSRVGKARKREQLIEREE